LISARAGMGRLNVGAPSASARLFGKPSTPKSSRRKKFLAIGDDNDYVRVAQFRTCLWPRAGRWASGQEAGQPPKEVDSLPCSCDRQPEAKPAHPALHGGRGLKQRRSGLFWSRWPSKGQHRRGLSILAGRAERDFPLQSKAASRVRSPAHLLRVSIARLMRAAPTR